VKGGAKFYRGSGRGARAYVEADHHRADDYYLAEGDGIAEIIQVDGAGTVTDRMQLDGDRYESWVEGVDIRTGLEKGTIRHDDHALRFVEVIVNGPKSWSLAAGLHPDIAAAYDVAQGHAIEEIAQFVGTNACTRVGPRGQQRQVPVQQVEMAAIRHYTSRGGDPHRHLHLQVNARVYAAGKWRGIDSAGLLRMQRAINGIGHRAVLADPQFRAALATHGYTVDAAGEIDQLAAVVPAMSKRSAQVKANIERYERQWRGENPGQQPGPALLRAWDERAWADKREAKKNHPTRGPECERAWLAELRSLGVDVDAHRVAEPVAVTGVQVGEVDRDEAAQRVVKVLAAGARGRSTWNRYDVRGVVEEILAGRQVIAPREVFRELAEDVTARALHRCQSVLDHPVVDHVRHLTSQEVIDLENDLHGRLAVRGGVDHHPASLDAVAAAVNRTGSDRVLDQGQVAAVQAIAGTAAVVLIEGAAGAGKTPVLSAANELTAAGTAAGEETAVEAGLTAQDLAVAREIVTSAGHQMMVVAPSKKASMVAAEEIGAHAATTAAGLAFAHGFRWDTDGVWTRLQPGQHDPVTGSVYRGPYQNGRLTAGDVLVIDEAGMLDQETARALLHIADETNARMVFVGDRRQLPAVGRGGVLEMVARWAPVQVELSAVHRFRTPDDTPDTTYADLSLRIRSGQYPAAVFTDLAAGGHVKLWDSEADALAHIAIEAAHRHLAGVSQAVAVDTNDTASAVNEIVREQLVTAGQVDDQNVVHGSDGLRIGVGDQVTTRRNDHETGVANRMTWTVTALTDTGDAELYNEKRGETATVDADYIRQHLHLAYASTVHGVQGETVDHADLMLTDNTTAAAAYVGLTRGRYTNTVHIVTQTIDDAREQWVQAASRNRADLGLDQACVAAATEASAVSPTVVSIRPRWSESSLSDRAGFAERLRRLSAQEDVPSAVVVDYANREVEEWDLDEHEGHRNPTQSGPRI
jgi:exodeoxyribonuclease V alpha subunit